MSEDHQPRPANRFSRFSRADTLPPPPPAAAEPSMEDIAARALKRTTTSAARQLRNEIPENFGSPEGYAPQSGQHQPTNYETRRHAAPSRIPEVVPVERVPMPVPNGIETGSDMLARSALAARGETVPAAETYLAPPPPQPVEVEVEIEPELPAHFARSGHDIPELPPARPITAQYEVVQPHSGPETLPREPKKRRFKMPTLPSSKARNGATGDAETEEKGPSFATRTLAAARNMAVPALQRSALWLAHNLQRRELRKRYSEAVVFAHNRIMDRKLEKLFFVPTLKGATKAPAPDQGILYDGPVPASVFDWVFSAIPDDLREFAFVDFRAGRGRSMLLASKRDFDRIIGFEFEPELFDDLQMNIAQYPRSLMKCRNIDCYRGDLDGISIPNQPSVLWFSAAWRDDMIPGILDYVRETYCQGQRRLYIVFANVGEQPLLEGDELFHRVDPGINQRLKLKLLSPMEFQIYRSVK